VSRVVLAAVAFQLPSTLSVDKRSRVSRVVLAAVALQLPSTLSQARASPICARSK